MTTFTITFTVPDDYAAVLFDSDADLMQEVADLFRFKLATITRLDWQDDAPALVIGAEEVQP